MKRLLVVVLAMPLWGCCSRLVVPEPGKITLQEALKEVGEGLVKMHSAEGSLKTGLIPSEVVVTFNVSASATDTDKLYVEVGAPTTGAPVTGKLGGEVSTTNAATRGNQVTIKFTNILFAPEKTLIQDKTPEALVDLLTKVFDLNRDKKIGIFAPSVQ